MKALGPAEGSGIDRRTILVWGGALGLLAVAGCSDTERHSITSTPNPEPTDPSLISKASGLDTPWSMVSRHDGSLLISERDTARIMVLSPDGSLTALAQLPQVVPGGEAGLLGLEIFAAPNGSEWLYAYMSTQDDNRVVRFELLNSTLGRAHDILTLIPLASIHNGG